MDLTQESYARIIDTLHDGLYCVDRKRQIVYWNKAAEHMSGFTADEVVGSSCADNVLTHVDAEGHSLCKEMCPLAATMNDGKSREVEVYMHHKQGHRVPVLIRTSALTNSRGEVIGAVELFTDISSRDAHELRIKELEHLAMVDRLTQLPNRHSMEKEIENRIEEKRRYNVPFGVFFLDIDHFKRFNDLYGHDAGDEVLRYVANTLVANSRAFDVYGRWGGEEFVGVVRNVTREDQMEIGERLRLLVENSYISHDGRRLQVTVSMGGTLVQDNDTLGSLIKRADMLMYDSKAAGRNRLTLDSGFAAPLAQAEQIV